MGPQNYTPLDEDTLRTLGEAAESLGAVAEQEKKMITVSVSPESPPITIEAKATEDTKPVESQPADEQKEAGETPAAPPTNYIEEKPEDIELPEELKNLGLKAMKQVDFPDFKNVKLPISDEKVMVGSKAPMNTSMRWLAEFAKFLLWRAHITLKTVHGRVIRVIKK